MDSKGRRKRKRLTNRILAIVEKGVDPRADDKVQARWTLENKELQRELKRAGKLGKIVNQAAKKAAGYSPFDEPQMTLIPRGQKEI